MSVSLLDRRSQRGLDLGRKTSMGTTGIADWAIIPETAEELGTVLGDLRGRGKEPFILGAGCNTLFPEQGFRRPIILTEKLRGLQFKDTLVLAEAGVRLDILIRLAIEHGLGGLEMFIGIPGTVGGATAMNAGGSGHEFGRLVKAVSGVHPETGKLVRVPAEQIEWRYRSACLNGLIVTSVELGLARGDCRELRERARQLMARKAATQPLNFDSAGCIFKNPPSDPDRPALSAGKLIEDAGLKGARIGGAMVSTKHANFIVNEGGAACGPDVLKLIELVRERVRECYQIHLELEIVVAEDEPSPPEPARGEVHHPCLNA